MSACRGSQGARVCVQVATAGYSRAPLPEFRARSLAPGSNANCSELAIERIFRYSLFKYLEYLNT